MKSSIYIVLSHIAVLLTLLIAGSAAQLRYRPHTDRHSYRKNSASGQLQASQGNQHPLIKTAMDSEGLNKLPPILGDIISIDRTISVFSGFTRSVEGISGRLADRNQNTTVLAPKNTAITSLPRKPWEDPSDEEEARAQGVNSEDLYRGESGEDRAADNLRRFVEVHMVGASPWGKGKENQIVTLGGKAVWWDEEAGVRKVSYPTFPQTVTVRPHSHMILDLPGWYRGRGKESRPPEWGDVDN